MGNNNWLDRAIITTRHCYKLCLTEEDFQASLEYIGIAPHFWPQFTLSDATTHFFEGNPNEEAVAIVTMKGWEGRDPIVVAGLLMHEAVHIWQETERLMGEDAAGAEEEAYAIQWIAQQLMWSFVEQTQSK